jgi:hypothetical protein
MTRLSRPAALVPVILLVLFAGFLTARGDDAPMDLIVQADLAFMTRYVPDTMTQAISLYEAVLPDLDTLPVATQAYVLDRLSELCYEVTTFTTGDTSDDENSFEKGKEYGLQSLRLNAQFAAEEKDNFKDALSYVTDAAALHWTASNWGKILGIHPIQGLLQQGSVLALFSRSVDVDPRYWGASSSSSLGSLLIMLPGPLGGDDDAGLALIHASIDADPSYLSNRVILAQYWGFTYGYFGDLTGIRDANLIEEQLGIVLDADIGDWPFWNRNAKQLAQELLDQLHNMQ